MLWTVALVLVATAVCATWNDYSARAALSQQLAHEVALVGQTAADGLATRLGTGWSDSAHAFLAGLTLDQRLAFVAFTDPRGRQQYVNAPDPAAWDAFLCKPGCDPAAGTTHVDQPIDLGPGHDLIARVLPVWTPRVSNSERRLGGFVIVALRDPGMARTLANLRLTHLASACVVGLLSLPVAFLGARYWTRPLRALMAGIDRLSSGRAPEPVHVCGQDELALLADAFNRMAQRLHGAYAELERANQDLEGKVCARTAELEGLNRRLQLETHSRDEFFRAVSHDLSAPLRNIGGLASLLLTRHQELLAQDARGKLERIAANVKVQAAMIHDLLELSRIRTPGGSRQALDLNLLLAELRDSLSYDLEQARVTLEVAGPLPTLIAERNRIRQVFQNLLDNAAKYMLDAPVRRIRVSCTTTERYYQFTVADTGPGIAPADLPRLFQVFQRGRGPQALRVPGRGVGLAGVKAIVESYGGTVGVDSTPGQGAAFHFTLDRHLVDSPTIAQPAA
jgi:signal transduction histidine kinase